MMRLKVMFVLLELFSLIGQIFGATLFTFGKEPLFLDRYREMSKSVHRGFLLSLTSRQKNEMCQNIYGSQFYIIDNMAEDGVNHGRTFYGRPYYVDPMSNFSHAHYEFFDRNMIVGRMGRSIGDTLKLLVHCTSKNFRDRKPIGKPDLYFSYAFKSMWLVIERQSEGHKNHFLPTHYAVISPVYIAFERIADLEEYYVSTQRNIGSLMMESPDYMTGVKGSYTFSNLSQRQKFVLCASILSNKVFHRQHLEFSFDWMNDIIEKKNDEVLDYEKKVLLETIDSSELPAVPCILCKAVEDVTIKNSKTTNLYVTNSYRNSYSAFVFIEKSDGIWLHSGFRNIPVLMPGHEDMNAHKLFLDIAGIEPEE